jgi:hypothetical protein
VTASIGCSEILGDPDRIVAIEVVGTTTPSLAVGETITLEARALNARGEVVPDAEVVWAILDTGQVGITIDAETGLVTATAEGTWRVRARVDDLVSRPITVTVQPAAAPGAAGQAPTAVAVPHRSLWRHA